MKQNKLRKKIFIIFSILCVMALAGLGLIYSTVFKSNVKTKAENTEVFIPKKSTTEEVAFLLKHAKIIDNERSFLWVAELKKFHMPSKGGRYIIQRGWSNNDIINTLRVGDEVPVNITFNNIRTQEELSARLAQQLDIDSSEIMAVFNNDKFIHSLGFDCETIISIFIPNTYQVYWTIGAKELFLRMKREYDNYWNEARRAKAKEIGFSPVDVITLASIIDEETQQAFEKPIIAGVYINRLKRGIPLQACPTLKFALNDFTIKRILYKHMEVESPYNTYKHRGLPPGPVRLPSTNSIEAVLNYQKHSYLYFTAKDDFSGTHYFSKTLKQHNIYAERYHRALNKQKIYK